MLAGTLHAASDNTDVVVPQKIEVPPPAFVINPALEPEIRNVSTDLGLEQHFYIRDRHYLTRVAPPGGTVFFLIDREGNGNFIRTDKIDPALEIPVWVRALVPVTQ